MLLRVLPLQDTMCSGGQIFYDACHAATSTQSIKSVGCCQVEETARRMGHAARSHVKQKFSRQAFGVQLNVIMTDMCQQ